MRNINKLAIAGIGMALLLTGCGTSTKVEAPAKKMPPIESPAPSVAGDMMAADEPLVLFSEVLTTSIDAARAAAKGGAIDEATLREALDANGGEGYSLGMNGARATIMGNPNGTHCMLTVDTSIVEIDLSDVMCATMAMGSDTDHEDKPVE